MMTYPAWRRLLPRSRTAGAGAAFFSSRTDGASGSAAAAFFGKGPRWSLQSLVKRRRSNSEGAASVDLDRIADLAHLKIADAARPGLERELGEILNMAALVQNATVGHGDADAGKDGAEEEAAAAAAAPLRKDAVTSADVSEELLVNAKRTEEGYFVVPNVQDGSP